MTISIDISGATEKALRAKAEATGIPAEQLAARMVADSLRFEIELRELSGPIGEAFKASGMTEDELGDLLEREKHAMRAERRKKAS